MAKYMPVAEAKKHFTELLRTLEDEITITRHNKPVAVILSLDAYKKLCKQNSYENILSLKQQVSQSLVTAEQVYKWTKEEQRKR